MDPNLRSAARHRGSEHKHGESIPRRRGAICAPLWRDAGRTRAFAFAFVHTGWGGCAGPALRGTHVDEACVKWVQALTWCAVRNL